MANYYTIPVNSDPNQSLACTIPINNKNIRLNLKIFYNDVAGYWTMRISDKDNNILVDSVPLLTGNFLEQYQYLGIGSAYIVNNGNSSMDSPDNTNLGTDFLLVWSDA